MCAPCFSVFWMRCSMSRTESRYSLSLPRSPAPERVGEAADFLADRIENAAGLPDVREPLPAVLPPSPNSRSKTTRGCVSAGLGVVSLRHDTVFT